MTFSPLILVKLVLWVLTIAWATVWLCKKRITSRVRTWFVIAGILVFGVLFGVRPNPVESLRVLFRALLTSQAVVPGLIVIFGVLVALGYVSNKSLCGWGCQFGLLQDLLMRVPTPKIHIPVVYAYWVRAMAFVLMIIAFAGWGLDWLGWIDPFRVFRWSFAFPSWGSGLVVIAGVLAASLFVYRPWCRILCPFGFVSWLVEQCAFLKPRIDWNACKKCQKCVSVCPGDAMNGIYHQRTVHPDCFACGACIEACPFNAIEWRRKEIWEERREE